MNFSLPNITKLSIRYDTKRKTKRIVIFFEKRQNSKFIVKNYTENSQLEKHIDVILHLILPVFFLSKYELPYTN